MVSLQDEDDGYDMVSELEEVISGKGPNQDNSGFHNDVAEVHEKIESQVIENPYYAIEDVSTAKITPSTLKSPNIENTEVIKITNNIYYDDGS